MCSFILVLLLLAKVMMSNMGLELGYLPITLEQYRHMREQAIQVELNTSAQTNSATLPGKIPIIAVPATNTTPQGYLPLSGIMEGADGGGAEGRRAMGIGEIVGDQGEGSSSMVISRSSIPGSIVGEVEMEIKGEADDVKGDWSRRGGRGGDTSRHSVRVPTPNE